MSQIYVLLPAFNEEAGLAALLPKLEAVERSLGERLRVVVVDDGSRDGTAEVAQRIGSRLDLHLLRFPVNRGVGEVFRAGLAWIVADSATPERDLAISLDADDTQDPATIPALAAAIRGGCDLAIASRQQPDGGMVGCPPMRRLLSRGASLVMRLGAGVPGVRDYSTFFRAYRVSLVARGFAVYGEGLLAGAGFAAVVGLLLRLAALTERLTEVPSVLHYGRKRGGSGLRIGRTLRGYLAVLTEERRRRRGARRSKRR